MRLLAALAYLVVGMSAYFSLVDEPTPYVVIPLGLFLLLSSELLFNEGGLSRLRGISYEDYLKNLERKGRALRERYEAHQALSFDDLSTGCRVHLIDIGENRVLCLYGQYLYEFEPIDDDPEVNQPRLFPTSEFELLRRRRNQEVLILFPGAEIVNPIVLTAPDLDKLRNHLYELGITLEDGEIVPNLPFTKLLKSVT